MDGVSSKVTSRCPLLISYLKTVVSACGSFKISSENLFLLCLNGLIFFQVRGLLEKDFEVQSDPNFKSKEICFTDLKKRIAFANINIA
jgi:hypothetical protein